MEQRHHPHDQAAPVVADEDRALDAERVEQADQVAGQVMDVVGGDLGRPLAVAVAALVGREHAEARRRPAPAPGGATSRPAPGNPWQQHDGRARCPRRAPPADAVGGDDAVREAGHGRGFVARVFPVGKPAGPELRRRSRAGTWQRRRVQGGGQMRSGRDGSTSHGAPRRASCGHAAASARGAVAHRAPAPGRRRAAACTRRPGAAAPRRAPPSSMSSTRTPERRRSVTRPTTPWRSIALSPTAVRNVTRRSPTA